MLKVRIAQILKDLSIPVHLNGYEYLKDAVEMMYNSSRPLRMTKEVYPAVAKKYHVTHGSVERAMRHAISKAWDRRDAEVYRTYFGIITTKDVPTNNEFIAVVTDVLRMDKEVTDNG